MTSRIQWRPEALADLKRLYRFIAEHNPQAALRAIEHIGERVELLAQWPQTGRVVDSEYGIRRLPIPFGDNGYILRYQWNGKAITILRIWHMREQQVH